MKKKLRSEHGALGWVQKLLQAVQINYRGGTSSLHLVNKKMAQNSGSSLTETRLGLTCVREYGQRCEAGN